MALPYEMIDEILCRIPVKHLLRFRCVSKRWCSLIDSSDFAKKQLKTALECNSGVGLLIKGDFDGDDRKMLNTLVGDYFLINPITRKFRMIPCEPPEFPMINENTDMYLCGFGYDEVNDDFKIVRIAQFNVKFIGFFNVQFCSLFVMVYSLKTNAWTQIEDVPSNIYFDGVGGEQFGGRGFFASGSLHWKAIEYPNGPAVIVGFDLTLQQFKDVPFPPVKYGSNVIGNLGEYLCIKDYHDGLVDVWLMNYRGDERTWYKALSSEFHLSGDAHCLFRDQFLAFSRSGEDVLLENRGPARTRLLWYNLDPNYSINTMRIRGFPVHFLSFVYTESLLQLNEDEDGPLQQKPSIDNHEKNIRDPQDSV